jgi:hypothetical protein
MMIPLVAHTGVVLNVLYDQQSLVIQTTSLTSSLVTM